MTRHGDADLVYPAGQKAKYQKAFDRFASVFPDTFYVSERGRYWPDQSTDNGRLLNAGYHNTGGYYRDDTALMQLILDKKGQDQLNRLWNEFDFVAHQTERTWVQYFFNQSGEVDGNINGNLSTESGSKRPVGHEVTDQFVINQMRDKYLARWAVDKEHNDPGRAQGLPLALRPDQHDLAQSGEGAYRGRAQASGRAGQVRRTRLSPPADGEGTRRPDGLLQDAAHQGPAVT